MNNITPAEQAEIDSRRSAAAAAMEAEADKIAATQRRVSKELGNNSPRFLGKKAMRASMNDRRTQVWSPAAVARYRIDNIEQIEAQKKQEAQKVQRQKQEAAAAEKRQRALEILANVKRAK